VDALSALRDARLALHAALTMIMAWLAVLLALPSDTFGTSQSYAVMERIAPEPVWAMSFWMVASVGVCGLFTIHRVLRLVSVLVLATAHGVLALSLVLANPATTGTGTYTVLAALGYYLAWRRTDDGF